MRWLQAVNYRIEHCDSWTELQTLHQWPGCSKSVFSFWHSLSGSITINKWMAILSPCFWPADPKSQCRLWRWSCRMFLATVIFIYVLSTSLSASSLQSIKLCQTFPASHPQTFCLSSHVSPTFIILLPFIYIQYHFMQWLTALPINEQYRG